MTHLHSIYLTEGDGDDGDFPPAIASNFESFRRHHPAFKHQVYGNDSGRDYIANNFEPEVVDAWDELVPFSYKSDLLRFCLLYKLGGIYADVSIHMFAPLEINPEARKVRLFRDVFNAAPWIVSTSLIYAPAGVELFARCVDRIVDHVRTGYYGFNPLCPAGPIMLGREVAAWGQLEQMILGESAGIVRNNGGTPAGRLFISAEDVLIGVVGKAKPGLAALGARTQNDYNEYYHRRKIYRRELMAPNVWTRTHYRERGMTNALAGSDNAARPDRFGPGCALYGPYISLDAGKYRANFLFRADAGESPPTKVRIDVCAGDVQVLAAQDIAARPSGDGTEFSLNFSLTERRENVEIRLFLAAACELNFDRMELTPLAAN